MENNTFKVDTQKSVKKSFLERVNGVYSAAIFLSGLSSVCGLIFLIKGLYEQIWTEIGVADFVLVDGNVLLFGLLLYIFGLLIQEGFKMQKELDEIL
ncbi:MAG: hypothetical protein IJX86_08995 [Lachnospiraceae bacterium]|nr:hypothetical protein [Lachnospiraceae bacterium]